ncbi:hypothetical protein L1987_32612 [Smallanthus sonchifolius]|uniref:Uncharacterized protein n=1 Tax=Smallanthus sonchifolius TaxID=185202 RepID=A0ACB9HPY9_9ASTR|nr:hypothetical protein L1987_32612 [Smallanthus sonchifolius]
MAIEAVVSVVLQKVADMLKGHRYIEAVYMVEDGIEKFTLNVVRRRKVFGFLTNHIFFFDNLNSCLKIHQKIKKIATQLMIKINNNGHYRSICKKDDKSSDTRATDHVSFSYSCNEDVMQIVGIKERFQQTKQMASFSYKEEELGVFGLKKDVDLLVNKLTNCEHVVLIVGQGDNASNKDDDEAMKFKVSEYLKNKRYLIILDGANSFNIREDIKEAFPDVKNGSKLVLTSSQKIEMEMETTQVSLFLHCMMPLSEDDSWKMFKEKKVPIKYGLDKLQDLRELGVTFFLASNQEDLMNWIANLKDLRSLRLRSKDNLGRASKLMVKSMSNLGRLSHLNLLGTLEKLPVLRLLGQSYIGKEMVCIKGGFSRLKVLKMWMLKELESWVVEGGSMQSLKHLEIRCCEKLQSIPSTLLQQPRLENLVLTGMPHTFTTDVERLKSDHTTMTIKHWKFPPLPVSS